MIAPYGHYRVPGSPEIHCPSCLAELVYPWCDVCGWQNGVDHRDLRRERNTTPAALFAGLTPAERAELAAKLGRWHRAANRAYDASGDQGVRFMRGELADTQARVLAGFPMKRDHRERD